MTENETRTTLERFHAWYKELIKSGYLLKATAGMEKEAIIIAEQLAAE